MAARPRGREAHGERLKPLGGFHHYLLLEAAKLLARKGLLLIRDESGTSGSSRLFCTRASSGVYLPITSIRVVQQGMRATWPIVRRKCHVRWCAWVITGRRRRSMSGRIFVIYGNHVQGPTQRQTSRVDLASPVIGPVRKSDTSSFGIDGSLGGNLTRYLLRSARHNTLLSASALCLAHKIFTDEQAPPPAKPLPKPSSR